MNFIIYYYILNNNNIKIKTYLNILFINTNQIKLIVMLIEVIQVVIYINKLDLIYIIKPDYCYVIDGIRHKRFNFKKNILIKEGYDLSKTEHKIMIKRKIYRIYNSGNFKFIYTKNNDNL
jgi:hypothetical protein